MSVEDSDPYCLENVPLFEALFGKNLISFGGTAAIENMFSGLDRKLSGLKALDVGFGLGGVAYYLAETYQMQVAGVEIYPWMVQYAKTNAPPNIAQLLKFDTYNAERKIPFEQASFDIVYSKGVLNHISDKDTLFRQVNTMLKPAGLFVITDWLYPKQQETDAWQVCETQQSYQQVLADTDFKKIEFRNDSKIFHSYVQLFLENLAKQRNYIEDSFGKEMFATILKQHQELIEGITHESKIATRIVARR
jgi:ubiquinone/menaquinone biosynthesis C-methylase UbiE